MKAWVIGLIGSGTMVVISVPMIVGIVPPNRIYGFRTARTLSDPVIWYESNRFSGIALLIAGVASAAVLLAVRKRAIKSNLLVITCFILPLLIAVIASFWHLG